MIVGDVEMTRRSVDFDDEMFRDMIGLLPLVTACLILAESILVLALLGGDQCRFMSEQPLSKNEKTITYVISEKVRRCRVREKETS